MAFFGNFDIFLGVAAVLPIYFIDIFATTDTTTHLQKKYSLIFFKWLFSDYLKWSDPSTLEFEKAKVLFSFKISKNGKNLIQHKYFICKYCIKLYEAFLRL